VPDRGLRHVLGGEDPVRGRRTGRGGQGAPGVGGEGEFHRRRRERPPGPLRIGVLQVHVQQRAGRLGPRRVGVVGAGQDELQPVGTDGVGQLGPDQGGLRLDLQTAEDERHRVAEPGEAGHADLEGLRRGAATDAGDADPVRTVGVQPYGVQPGDHVRAEVIRGVDLVEQLRGDRLQRHRAPGARMLGHHRRPVGGDLRDREAGAKPPVGQLGEEAEVAAGDLRAALEQMAGHGRPGQSVEVVWRPAEVGDRRPDDQRGVGDPPGYHHLRAGGQTGRDTEPAEVRVRGQRVRPIEGVGVDVSDAHRYAEPPGQLAQRGGQAGRVQSAGVGDDAYPTLDGGAQAGLHLPQEGTGVAEVRIAQPVPAEDQHGQLSEVVAGQDIQLATVEHLPPGGEPVAVEAGGVADPQGRAFGGGDPPVELGRLLSQAGLQAVELDHLPSRWRVWMRAVIGQAVRAPEVSLISRAS
jgi:hypothetical protein